MIPQFLFHGSGVPAIRELQPRSKLHQSQENVVYLTSNSDYALFYLWDAEKTHSPKKWVTAWCRDGVACYEEQFDGQLEAFYGGVRGYLYRVLPQEGLSPVPQREMLWYSTTTVPVYGITEIPNVYEALCRREREGKVKIFRFAERDAVKQNELTERITSYIRENGLLTQDTPHARFIQRYFVQAWEQAKHVGERKEYAVSCI